MKRSQLWLVFSVATCLNLSCKHTGESNVKDAESADTQPEIPAEAAKPPVQTDASPAEKNILELNNKMFPIYDAALESFKKEFLRTHPVILALFSGAGGKFLLYQPGKPPVEAPAPGRLYQLVKSIGHTAIAIYSILTPYAKDPQSQQGWVEPLQQTSGNIAKALATLNDLQVSRDDRELMRGMLTAEKVFVDSVLAKGAYTSQEIEDFSRSMKPWIKKIGDVAGKVQVNHWVDVLTGWKKMLGTDWAKVHAMSNTIYVTRQNNILYSILVQFMGTDAINRRLLLVETTSFTTTPDDMLGLLSRILNDRELGQAFFNDKMLMDSELFGSAARGALDGAMKRVGKQAVLPDYAHFNSNEWPWRTNPAYGDGPRTIDETKD